MLAIALVVAASLAAAPLTPPPPAAPPRAGPDPLRALAAIAAGEPDVAEVVAAAAREADRGTGRVDGFPGRARLAALLPRLTAEYRHDERSYRVVGLQGSGEVDYLRLAPGNTYVLRATWDLGDLVAARGELAAEAAARARGKRRELAVRRATALFFERRRAQLALLLDPPSAPLARAEAELALDRLTAELDVATGGLLSGSARR